MNSATAYDVLGVRPNAIGLPEINIVLRPSAVAAPTPG
jgi:hypothetical protein